MTFLLLNFRDISKFFKIYEKNLTAGNTMAAGNYITIYTYLGLLILLIANITIMSLMKSKRKSIKFYLISTLYYIALLGSTLIFFATFSAIDKGTPDATLISFIRSLALLITLPSYVLILITATQAVGFNYKTFRFDKTTDLQITDEDEEEVELKLLKNDGTAKRNIVHSLRELKYYALENKGIFTLLGIVFFLFIAISLYLEFEVYNKRYNLYQAFTLDSFSMTIKESYITDVDFGGTPVIDGKYYLAVKIAIFNKTAKPASIGKENFRLFFDDEYVYPTYDVSSRFIDIGQNYEGLLIAPQSGDDYVLVYVLDEKQLKSKYKLKILSSLKQEPGELVPSYKIINIKPKNIISAKILKDKKVGDTVNLSDTFLGKTKYTLQSIHYANSYLYEYEQCTSITGCYTRKASVMPKSGNILLVIKDAIEWDNTTPYYKHNTIDFYRDFTKLEYTYKTTTGKKINYKVNITNVTPPTLAGVKLYEVGNLAAKSSDVKLKIQIRNSSFYIKINRLSELKR
jgi:hypothetical protein